jgi:hypothetical protein
MLIEVVLYATGSTVRVEVSDPGRGFEPDPPRADPERGQGFGLFLVDQLADRWGVMNRPSSRVWFEIDRS